MKKQLFLCALAAIGSVQAMAQGLKDAYRDYWRMGVSVNQWEVAAERNAEREADRSSDAGQAGNSSTPMSAEKNAGSRASSGTGANAGNFAVVEQHFDWLVAENCMKCETIHPKEGVYDFTLADQLVDLARAKGMHVVGHCLVWHAQCAKWFFVDDDGNQVSAEVLKKRLRDHIFTILGHFRGRVEGWDVVNEAFNDDGSLRQSKFYEILGEDFIPLAFQYAHEADPTAELYYNDYSMNNPAKCDGVVNFFRPLVAKGLPIHAIGMQGHMTLGDADYVSQYERSIRAITSIGLKTQFTELDLSVLPSPWGFSGAEVSSDFEYRKKMDPYPDALPASVQQRADDFWVSFFEMLLPYKDSILRMGFWNVNDGNSWRNGFPIKGRTDYATLFDRQNQPKPAVQRLIDLVSPKPEAATRRKGRSPKR